MGDAKLGYKHQPVSQGLKLGSNACSMTNIPHESLNPLPMMVTDETIPTSSPRVPLRSPIRIQLEPSLIRSEPVDRVNSVVPSFLPLAHTIKELTS